MVEVKDLSAGYGRKDILHNVSFTARPGEVTAIIGKNGCGKSTLLKAVTGILPASAGEILINSSPISSLSTSERARLTAYLPQGKRTPDITAGRMVLHGRFPYLSYPRKYKKEDYAIAAESMEQMGIAELANTPMAELSGGTRQKVYLAMALAQRAPVIVMDEPTAYLDIGQQMRFAKIVGALAEKGKTILLVLHDLPFALKLCRQICVMENGRMLHQGAPKEIRESGVIERLYGIEVRAVATPEGEQYYYQQ